MVKTFKISIKSGEYDKAFDTFYAELKKDTINLHNLEIYDEERRIDNPEEFLQKCTSENQNKFISYLIEKGVPSDFFSGGLPIGLTIASGENFIPYIRALDFDHLTQEAYDEIESLISEDWEETDIELYVIIYFNGDIFRLMDLEFLPESLLDKIDEDDEFYDKLIEILKRERDIFAQKISKEAANESYEEFIEAIEE